MLANYILNGNVVNLVLDGPLHTIRPSHHNYSKLKEFCIGQQDLELNVWKELLNPAIQKVAQINEYNPSLKVELKGGYIYYNGLELNNYLTKKILEFKEQNLPYQPLLAFLERIMNNPSRRSIEQLYNFLSNKGMPITPDGYFLGYKGVNKDFSSKSEYNGRNGNPFIVSIPNTWVPGGKPWSEKPPVNRNWVDDDWNNGCSHGLHVGSYDYAKNWAGPDGIVIMVKVDPADCVTVPHNEHDKLRCATYFSVKVVEDILSTSYYDEDGFEEEEIVEDNYMPNYNGNY